MNEVKSGLEKRVVEALAEITQVQNAAIAVLVEGNGVVTLKGTAPSIRFREEAGRIAEAQEGVLEVINDLEVVQPDDDPDGPPFPPHWLGRL